MEVLKKNGFTFVELIIATIIVGVLAIGSIMVYQGYQQRAAQETVNNLAETAAAAAHSFWIRNNANPPGVDALNLFIPNPGRYVIAIIPPDIQVQDVQNNIIVNVNYQQ